MKWSEVIACLLLAGTTAAAASGAESAQAQTCPALPGEPGWLEQQIQRRETDVERERAQAIARLREFLARHPAAPQRADALFRLAELQWEQAEAQVLQQMRAYDQALEAIRGGSTTERPPEPRIDLGSSLTLYEEILEHHPDFERTDAVLYLYGFALNERGDEETALSIYRSLLKRFPNSDFAPDAQLSIGEYHFAKGQFTEAREAYERVLQNPSSDLFDLALYKSAWCHFKEGHPKDAAERFRRVLSRARERQQNRRLAAAAADLEREAVEDLAMTFSEYGGAKEAYRFMAQVGGEEYSIGVLRRLGEVFFRQARFDKAIDTYRMLVARFPMAEESPEHQQRIAEAYERRGGIEQALTERMRLAENYGPGSEFIRHHASRPEIVERAVAMAEEAMRHVALARHQQAQKTKNPKNYSAAARAYEQYLQRFADSPQAPRIHFFLGEALFQLGEFAKAAEHYRLTVQKSEDQGLQREAGYAAILSYNRLRPPAPADLKPPDKEQPLSEAETGFTEAVEEFAALAPADERLGQLRFEVGRVLYTRGHFIEAAGALLDLVARHPKDKFAEPAADLALDCFRQAKDWTSLEAAARRLKKEGRFAAKPLGAELGNIISGSIFQQATALATAGRQQEASKSFLRLVEEFPGGELAAKALFNAAVALEKAGEKAQAIETYGQVIARYPDRAADAWFVVAGIFEHQYDYARSAERYAEFAAHFPADSRAPESLLQAAILRRAQRAFADEAGLLTRFTERFPNHPKAAEALLAAGLAQRRAGAVREAENAFSLFLKKHAARLNRVREATLQLGQVQLSQGKTRSASKLFERCGNFPAGRPPAGSELAAAAECLFMQGELIFGEYEKIALRPPMSQLTRLLNQKAGLLKKAEGLFTRVVAAGHMEWASAALYRIGDMYARFASAIYAAPLPEGLGEKELEVYRQELQSLAFPIEDKALSAFTLSHQMALKHSYYSRWSEKTIEMLRKLDPAQYPKEEELRPATGWADSFTTGPLQLRPLPMPEPPPRPSAAGQPPPAGGKR